MNILPPSSAWKTDFKFILNVSQKMFYAYVAMKKEGSAGQQKKAVRMLHSGKIVLVKCFIDADDTHKRDIFIKAMIKK